MPAVFHSFVGVGKCVNIKIDVRERIRTSGVLGIFRDAKIWVGLLASVLLVTGVESQAGGMPDNHISALMGSRMVKILMTPDRVEAFEVGPVLNPGSRGLSDYSILKQLGLVTKDISSEISNLALNDKNHVFELQKKCRFRPVMGYRFHLSAESVNVLFSSHCKQWLFDSGEIQIYEDFDPVADRIEDLMRRTRAQAN